MDQSFVGTSDAQNEIQKAFEDRKSLVDKKTNELIAKIDILNGDRQSINNSRLEIKDYLEKTDVESEIEKIKSQYS